MTKLMRSFLLTLGAAVLALGSAASLAESKGVIKIHEGDWTGNFVDTKLVELILKEEMGYEVEMVFLPAGPATYEAILSGDVDIGMEFWPATTPEAYHYIEHFGGNGSVEYFGDVGIVGAQGWWVPRYMIEGDPDRGIEAVAPDLKNWEQLNQYAHLFTTPETTPKGPHHRVSRPRLAVRKHTPGHCPETRLRDRHVGFHDRRDGGGRCLLCTRSARLGVFVDAALGFLQVRSGAYQVARVHRGMRGRRWRLGTALRLRLAGRHPI